nr:MAG TPA: hypothetical protein [Caudoviricetes sp.]
MTILSFFKDRLDLSNLISTALILESFIVELSRLFLFPLYGYRFGLISSPLSNMV